MVNFRTPYFSRDIAEFCYDGMPFSWFRDYLYIPLGGSKVGRQMAVRNTTDRISGKWFLAWSQLDIYCLGSIALFVLFVITTYEQKPNTYQSSTYF